MVKDYKADELELFREQLRPVASRYRWHIRLFLLGVAGFLGNIVCGVIFRMEWFFVPAIIFHLVGLAAGLTVPLLECPACNGCLYRFKRYCPECGSTKFEAEGGSLPSYCGSCQKQLRSGKRRNFKVRSCTHCGIPLDEQGL